MTDQRYVEGVGRRKTAIARVRLVPGKGKLVVNDRPPEEYFGARDVWFETIRKPLSVTGTEGQYDISVHVVGGGPTGQVGAVSHGLARALVGVDENFRVALRHAGLLTRDPRAKERKKVGLKRARKRPQYTKR